MKLQSLPNRERLLVMWIEMALFPRLPEVFEVLPAVGECEPVVSLSDLWRVWCERRDLLHGSSLADAWASADWRATRLNVLNGALKALTDVDPHIKGEAA